MQKIKYFISSNQGKDVLTVVILILVGLGSFGLGRLSKNSNEGLKIDYTASNFNQMSPNSSNQQNIPISSNFSGNSNNNKTGNYFASSRGKKYYSTSCSAGKTIKVENRVYFASALAAQEAGYELSSSCR